MKPTKFIAITLLVASNQAVQASGFGLIEQSASGQGLSYAGAAASSEDASVMWFNPAGLTAIEGAQLIGGLHMISPSSKFSNSGSTGVIAPATGGFLEGRDDDGATVGLVPNFYWKNRIADYDVGLGINVPFGQRIAYKSDWVGRYHATETDLKTYNINPAIARKVNEKLSFGFGLNAQYISVLLEQKVNQSALGDRDANAKVTGSSWAFGYNLGFMFKPVESVNIGLSYRSKIKHDVSGSVEYSGVNETEYLPGGYTLNQVLFDANASSTVNLPATASLALDYRVTRQLQLLASTTWTGWGSYDELVVKFENGSGVSKSGQNFKNSMRYAAGLIYQLDETWKLRTGVAYDKAPVPDEVSRSPRTPDANRTWLSIGAGYKVSDELSLDLAYSHLMASTVGSEYVHQSNLGNSVLKGSYDISVNILSAQLVWKY